MPHVRAHQSLWCYSCRLLLCFDFCAPRLYQVLSLVEAAIPDLDERGISNCIHSLAALELDQERQLLGSLLAAAEAVRLSRFTPQGLANITWALGALRVNPGPRLTAQLLSAAAGSLTKFSARELAQLGWGMASLRIRVDEGWLQPWQAAVVKALPDLSPQGLSMLLWATARLTDSQQPSITAAVAAATAAAAAGDYLADVSSGDGNSSSSSHSSNGSGRDASELAWLLAAEETLAAQLPDHTPHSVSICLWALGKLGYRPRREVTSEYHANSHTHTVSLFADVLLAHIISLAAG